MLGVPNSTMVQTVMEWLSSSLPSDGSIVIDDLTDQTSIIALQGPNSEKILADVLGKENVVQRFRCQEIMSNDLDIEAKTIHFKGFVVNLGPKVISQRPGSGPERFLEVFCFNVTEHEPVTCHMSSNGDYMDPFWPLCIHMGSIKALLD